VKLLSCAISLFEADWAVEAEVEWKNDVARTNLNLQLQSDLSSSDKFC